MFLSLLLMALFALLIIAKLHLLLIIVLGVIVTVPISIFFFILSIALVFSSKNYLRESDEVFLATGEIKYKYYIKGGDRFMFDSDFIKPIYGINWKKDLLERTGKELCSENLILVSGCH